MSIPRPARAARSERPSVSMLAWIGTVVGLLVVSALLVGVLAGPTAATVDGDAPRASALQAEPSPSATTTPSLQDESSPSAAPTPALQDAPANVSEEEYAVPAPEQGDPFFEEAAEDGSWVSYINPRDEYRDPYLGNGSGKLCVTLLNEAGDPVAGGSVPNTTVTIPTDESLTWHEVADPFTVEFPLNEHYERPFDSDQFGTTEDLPQGDGYMDAHCLEWHGLPENETVEYGEPTIEGEHADRIEVAGYVQQAHEAWETDVDPLEAAEPYAEAGGWTYEPGGSHGQAVVVLQLDGADGGDGTVAAADGDDGDGGDGGGDSDWPLGVGAIAASIAVIAAAVAAVRYRR